MRATYAVARACTSPSTSSSSSSSSSLWRAQRRSYSAGRWQRGRRRGAGTTDQAKPWSASRPAPRLDDDSRPPLLWGEQEGDDVDELNVALTDHNPHTLLRPSPAELARGRALFERHSASGVAHTGAELVSTAHVNAIEELPEPDPLHVPEVAFAGRSNVGKSSLLGRLMRADSHFVKASSTPGKTQSVNFYAFQPKMQFGMVDLPGYGFARASREESLEWRRNIARYLTSRQGALRRVFLLVDIRVGLKKSDHDFMRSLEEDGRIPYQLVLTKADKLSRSRIQRQLETVLADAQVESERRGKRMGLHPRVVITSATRDLGLDEMRAHVSEACSVS